MFELNDEHLAIQEAAKRFADDRMAPHAAKWDEEKIFPIDVLREAAELGFASIYIKEDVGGSGLGRLESTLIFEQLSQACPSTAAFISIHNMASWMIDAYGNEEQRKRWLPKLVPMDLIASYCLTEPSSGSDAASLRTKAVRDGDDYVLNGSKAFISGGGTSDIYVVMTRTSDDGAKGISTFVVEKGTPGLSYGAQEKKLGWNSQPTSMVMFDDCRVPAANRLGEEGVGFKIAMSGLDGGRLNIAACSLGGAQACYDTAVAYALERQQFGRAIADFQATQFKLADMATEIEAGRLLLRNAAAKLDAKAHDATRHCAMAKRFVTDMGSQVADDALQIHGGYGYLRDYPIERFVRDLRVHRILEGTNEIMRVIISRDTIGKRRNR